MITIKIGESEERNYKDLGSDWINQQINQRRKDGIAVCVRVQIKAGHISMILTTPACQRCPGGRPPEDDEKRIFALWDKMHLNSEDFTGGNLVAFLKQVSNFL